MYSDANWARDILTQTGLGMLMIEKVLRGVVFMWELVEYGTLTLEFIHTNDQEADLFTKPLNSKRFEFLRQNIGVIAMG